MIDITSTAMVRADIVKQTLKSFTDKMLGVMENYRVIVNVDPAGTGRDCTDQYDIVKLYEKYLWAHSYMITRCPTKCSFPEAFKWVWSQVESDYVFHLEDDWLLLEDVDIFAMIDMMEKHKDLAILRLPHKKTEEMSKNWNKFIPFNGEFFEVPIELKTRIGFSGHPSLIRKEFITNTLMHLDNIRNPEKQFHNRNNKGMVDEIMKWRYGVWAKPYEPVVIKDIGQKWMIRNGFKKEHPKAHFTKWELA